MDRRAVEPVDRLARIDPVVLDVVQTVAAVGRVAVRDTPAVLGAGAAAVATVTRSGLVVVEDGSLVVADPAVGNAALRLLSEPDRRALHARLARTPVPPAEAARQRDLATPPGIDEALAADLERAAAIAEQAGHIGPALELWTRAAARSSPDAGARNRRELRVAEQTHLAGHFAQAASMLEALDWATLTGEEAERAAGRLTSATYRAAGLPAARLRLRRVIDSLPVDHPHRDLLAIRLMGIAEDFGEAWRGLEAALPQLRSGRFSPQFQHAELGRLLYAELMSGQGLDTGLLAEIHALEPQLPDLPLEDTATAKKAMYAWVVDDLTTSDRALARSLVRAELAENDGFTRALLVHSAQVDVLLGRCASAARRLEQHRTLTGGPPVSPAAVRAAGSLALERGDHDDVLRVVGRAPTSGTTPIGQLAQSVLRGLLLFQAGGTPAAVAQPLQEAMAICDRLGIREPGRRLWIDVDLARTHVQRGDLDRARAIAVSLRRLGDGGRQLPVLQADRIEAWLADAQDRPRDRLDRALGVLGAAETMQWVPERARVTSEMLHLLRDADLDDRMHRWVTGTARAALAQLEDGVARRALARDLATWEQADLQALTPAERRVTDAVAAGMSNREVAEVLFLSTRTVESHLRNIYLKLGLASRSQLVARFVRPRT